MLESFTGQGSEPDAPENTLTGDVSIAAGATHTCEVGVLFTLDGDTLTAESARCADEPGDGTRSGLLNVGLLDHNGHDLDADACEPVEPEQPGDPDDPDSPGGPDEPTDPDDLADTGSNVSLWLLAVTAAGMSAMVKPTMAAMVRYLCARRILPLPFAEWRWVPSRPGRRRSRWRWHASSTAGPSDSAPFAPM